MVMVLSSRSLENGEKIPTQFTCDGDDVSPPFERSGAPVGSRSLLYSAPTPMRLPGSFSTGQRTISLQSGPS